MECEMNKNYVRRQLILSAYIWGVLHKVIENSKQNDFLYKNMC